MTRSAQRLSAVAALAAVVVMALAAAPAVAQQGDAPGSAPQPLAEPVPRKSVQDRPTDRPTDVANPPAVQLLTFGVGEVIFEKFGHSALCLVYDDPRIGTICFNYGVTDFADTQKLVWGFLRGKQKFWVQPTPLGHTLAFYRHEDRTIQSQMLPVTPEQARAFEEKLWFDSQEENRYYYYDHFYDNCTTRLRDMIDEVYGGVLRKDTDAMIPRTFRSIGWANLAELAPLLAITDFIVGRDLDHAPNLWESMFLPDMLRDTVRDRLGAPVELVYERRGPAFQDKLLETPPPADYGRLLVVLISLGFSLPLLAARLTGRLERVARAWGVVPLIAMGLLIWALMIVSPMAGLRWNEAAFLFVPTDVIIPFLGDAARRRYTRVRLGMVVLVSLLAAVGIFKQPLWVPILVAFQPLALLALELPWRRRAVAVADAKATAVVAA